MKKKLIIYLLTAVMAFSPAAVFAGAIEDEGGSDPQTAEAVAAEEGQEAAAEEAEPAAETPDENAEEAAEEDAEAAEEEAAEEAVEEEPAEAVEEQAPAEIVAPGSINVDAADSKVNAGESGETEETPKNKWNDDRTIYYDANGNPTKGLFKAPSKNLEDFNELYYANESGYVEKFTRIQKVTSGDLFTVVSEGGGKGFSKNTSLSYPQYYYISGTNGDYFVPTTEQIVDYNGKKYYVQKNGTVKATAGVFTYTDGNKYYVPGNSEGAIQTTQGWVTDTNGTRYYIPANAGGKIATDQNVFDYAGKRWYRASGGAVKTNSGLVTKGSNLYYCQSDGSIKTTQGFITVGKKKYLVTSGGAISKIAGVITYKGKKYVAKSDGSIVTKKGFVWAGGNKYYVYKKSGVIRFNKSFKVKGKRYHAKSSGKIAIGLHKWKGVYYYSTKSGALKTKDGIIDWKGNRYHVNKGGKTTVNKKVKYKKWWYICGKGSGKIKKGLFKWKGDLYFSSLNKGVLKVNAGFITYEGKKYYVRSGGKIYVDASFWANGDKYHAGDDGAIIIGYHRWYGDYYITDNDGAIYTRKGIYTINGRRYFVKTGGALASNEIVKYNKKYYYVGRDGMIVTTSFRFNGVYVTPNSRTGEISKEDYYRIYPEKKPKEKKPEEDNTNTNNNNTNNDSNNTDNNDSTNTQTT